jgi:hypothetical protein
VKRTLCGLMLLTVIGCSESPTAPTSAPSIAAQLRWNVTSASCAPVSQPPTQPDFSTARISEDGSGRVTASWPYMMNNRSATLYAHFVRENGGWAMCSWDVADI